MKRKEQRNGVNGMECDVKLSDRKIQFGFQFVIVEAAFLTLENLMTINVMNGEVLPQR